MAKRWRGARTVPEINLSRIIPVLIEENSSFSKILYSDSCGTHGKGTRGCTMELHGPIERVIPRLSADVSPLPPPFASVPTLPSYATTIRTSSLDLTL